MPDREGYPTRDELQALLDFQGTPQQFFDYLCSLWEYDRYAVTNGRSFSGQVFRINISTVGWSGNEDIIGVLKQTWFWFMWWQKSERGGHYMFEVPKKMWDKDFTRADGIKAFGLPHSSIDK